MQKIIYSILKKLTKLFFRGLVIGKKLSNHKNKILYYELDQHLTFLFNKSIRYESNLQSKLKSNISKGDLIFDIGSNIGQYALVFSELVGINGRVICYEPDVKNFSFLNFNVLRNNCLNIICENLGIGEKTEAKKFYSDSLTGGRRSSFVKKFVGESHTGVSYEVKISTLGEQMLKYGVPDFIKVDVEGFEVEIFKNVNLDPSKTSVFIEVRESTKDKIYSIFSTMGYDCYLMDLEEEVFISNPLEIPSFANLLFKSNQ